MMLKTTQNEILVNEREDEITSIFNTRVPPYVRVINGSLDEAPGSPHSIILTGRLDPNTLRFLKVDKSYQRPLKSRADIFTAFKEGTVVPPVEIGVRGEDFECDGDDFIIKAPAFIIDGWQRVGNAMEILNRDPNFPIRLFGTLHFGTDDKWERKRFTNLNRNVQKVAPNLHLRNMRHENPAVLTLYGLCENQKDFPLYRRVCWSQNMSRKDLTGAMIVATTACRLHQHIRGGTSGRSTENIAEKIHTAADAITLALFRKNVVTFFDVVEECWGIRDIEYRTAATQLKGVFLDRLARLFSSHFDFWDAADRKLVIPAKHLQRLAKFPTQDPHIRNLASSAGPSREILYDLMVKHMNSGRSTGRLQLRYGVNGR